MNANTISGTNTISHSATVASAQAGKRLDQIAVDLFPRFSRARLQAWIKSGELKVNGRVLKQTAKLNGGEEITIVGQLPTETAWQAEDMALPIVYEDSSLLVINKPAGLVVHPAAGNREGTLLNGLLAYDENFRSLPRAGIVHRLDKDTSGLMVVARTLEAQNSLVQQLQARTVKRQYRAFTIGGPDADGSVETLIGRHPAVRTKMAVVKSGGKEAITHYRVRRKLGYFRDLEINLETGRTHQIRVHMHWLGYPLIGDVLYGGNKLPAKRELAETLRTAVEGFSRQALHAQSLGLLHPESGKQMSWKVTLPEDMQNLLDSMTEFA